jgi:cell wall-associated NlpC family hydrolase
MPTWFIENRPMDPHHIFAAATATAPRLQLASSKAASRARGDIAATMETRFEGLTKQFQEEVGQGPNAESVSQFTQAYQTVVSRTINGAEVVKRDIRREDGGYRAYVLMRMPIGEAQETLLRQIQAQETAYSRFRSSTAYDSLEQDVGGYRERAEARQARQKGRRSGTGEVTEREAAPESRRRAGDAPTEEEVRAPEGGQGGASPSRVQRIKSRVRTAMEPWLGTPYKFGGETKNGVDCSALVQALYEDAFDIGLPRTTGKQHREGRPVDRSQMRAGDLVFFQTGDSQRHVGIYLEDRKFVHASSSEGVTVSPLKYEYWKNHYWKTKRFSVL